LKKWFGRFVSCLICFAIGAMAVMYGPELYVKVFGGSNTKWISQKLSESLIEKSELVVYEVETAGVETASQEAWLIGTVQKVEMPYTFSMHFTVDLTQAKVTAEDQLVSVHLPLPTAGYQKLIVDDEKMTKMDWLYPLTAERYAAMKQELEDRLFLQYAQNDECRQQAWDTAVRNLRDLFQSVVNQSVLGGTCDIQIIPAE